MLLAILHETGGGLQDLLEGLPEPEAATIERTIFAEQAGNDLTVHFRYAKHNAEYSLARARLEDFEIAIKTLRDGLARLVAAETGQSEAIKTDAVARAFLAAAGCGRMLTRPIFGGS